MAEAIGSVLALMTRALGAVFQSETWATWRAVLGAAFALPLTEAERAIVVELTNRQVLPTKPVRELWLLLGRRSGKSIIAALIAVWATCCRSYRLAPGEVGVFMVVASDRRQARIIKKYISGLLAAVTALAVLVDHETADAIWLTNGLCIEIHACSFRSLRGYTCIGAAVDEVSFWTTEDSANPDTEVLNALRAAMASVPEAMLIAVTTLYAKRGEVGRIWDRHHGQDDSASVLVVNGPTLTMNPTIDADVIAAAYADDPVAAAAEFGGVFRRDVESLLTRDAIDAVTMTGRRQLPPVAGVTYHAFTDPAGGSGTDSFTAAVAHVDATSGKGVLDLVFEQRPPFSPEQTVTEIASAVKPYGVTRVIGDHYAGEWPREQFQKHDLIYWPSDKTKSDLYRESVPLVNSRRVELLDVPRLAAQFVGLERRTARGGKDSIDHGPGSKAHDDVCNAAAGALVEACAFGAQVAGVGVGHVVTDTDHRVQDDARRRLEERERDGFHFSQQLGWVRTMRPVVAEDDESAVLHDADPWQQ